MLLKAVNGKHLGYGECFDNEDAVKTEIIKAMLVLKDSSSLYRNNNIEEAAPMFFYINYQTYMEPFKPRTKILLIVGASRLLFRK
jgi:hypothetical protein